MPLEVHEEIWVALLESRVDARRLNREQATALRTLRDRADGDELRRIDALLAAGADDALARGRARAGGDNVRSAMFAPGADAPPGNATDGTPPAAAADMFT